MAAGKVANLSEGLQSIEPGYGDLVSSADQNCL